MDMENVFKYKYVKDVCCNVSEILDIDLHSVHPVVNYNEESTPSVAQNVLSLMALWNIVDCARKHFKQKFKTSRLMKMTINT